MNTKQLQDRYYSNPPICLYGRTKYKDLKGKIMQPSDFLEHPWDSIAQNAKAEIVTRNIMVILSRTGDKFRVLSWEEYKVERLKDGNFSKTEKSYFDDWSGYCYTAESAILFSPTWRVK